MTQRIDRLLNHIPTIDQVDRALREAARGEPDAPATAPSALGLISLVSALGLLLIALAYTGGRAGLAASQALYWIGLGVMVTPIVIRLLRRDIGRGERIGLIVILSLLLYGTKLLYAPTEFQFADEFAHLRSTSNALANDGLFVGSNALLPVSRYYPGLHSATVALVELSGLSSFQAGLLLIGAARLVLALALYLLYERCSGSPRVAALGACIYMANPTFPFFSSYYIYQSLAVPLAALLLVIVAEEADAGGAERRGRALLALVCLAAVVVTHHVTSIALLAFLGAWAIVEEVTGRRRRAPLAWALLTAGAVGGWALAVGAPLLDYLGQPLGEALAGIAGGFAGASAPAEIRPTAGPPLYERLMSLGAAAVIALSLPLTLGLIWLRYPRQPLALALGVCAGAFVGTIMLRLFSAEGAELAGRTWTFVFLGVAFGLANLAAELYRRLGQWRLPDGATVAVLTGLFFGAVSSGLPPHWARLPGPYLASAFERSVTPEGIAVARWAERSLGPERVFAADVTNYDLLAAYGAQRPIRGLSWIYFDASLGSAEREDIARKGVEYFVVDRRLSGSLPATGVYFEGGEPGAGEHRAPIDPALLEKFARQADLSRIYDSGHIAIYDVGAWADER